MLNDWITYLLSGERVAVHSNAGESMLYDVSRRAWSEEILGALDIPAHILPPLAAAGARAGRVTAAAAAATGLPEGTPVFVGGADTECALLGSGVHEPGETGAVLGTTTPVQMVTAAPVIDPAGRLWTSCHVVPDRWVLESNAGDTGGAYRWLLELVYGATDAGAYAAAEAAIAGASPGERQIFCHLGPAIFSLADMSPFKPAGMLFRFPLLHVDRPVRGEVLRAYLESIAFAIRGNCEQIAAVAGRPIPLLAVSGGMTQSPTLVRLVADTLGVPVSVAGVPESASLGCAILAAVGAGVCASTAAGVSTMTSARRVDPDPRRHLRPGRRGRRHRAPAVAGVPPRARRVWRRRRARGVPAPLDRGRLRPRVRLPDVLAADRPRRAPGAEGARLLGPPARGRRPLPGCARGASPPPPDAPAGARDQHRPRRGELRPRAAGRGGPPPRGPPPAGLPLLPRGSRRLA